MGSAVVKPIATNEDTPEEERASNELETDNAGNENASETDGQGEGEASTPAERLKEGSKSFKPAPLLVAKVLWVNNG